MELDLYKRLLQADGGNISGANTNSTINAIDSTFADSPFYVKGQLNGVDFDWRFNGETNQKNQYQDKEFLFRPKSNVERGDIITTNADTWIVVDRNYFNPIFPKGSVSLCNESIKWKDASGAVYSYPCVTIPYRAIRNIQVDSFSTNMPQGHMFVLVQMNADTTSVVLKQRFIFGNQVYEISGVDDSNYAYDGKGLIYFTVGVTTKDNFNDDLANKIADNSFLYRGTTPTPSSITKSSDNTTVQTGGGIKSW